MNTTCQYSVIILAAGQGTRMKSDIPKVMHKVAERPIIDYVIEAAENLHPKEITILSRQDAVPLNEHLKDKNIKISYQAEQLGTAHAVKIGLDNLSLNTDITVVLYGDSPFIQTEHIINASAKMQKDNASVCVLSFNYDKPNQYGRLFTTENNLVQKIVEFKDLKPIEDSNLFNSGVMLFNSKHIKQLISEVKNENNKKEFYLTDCVEIANKSNLKVIYEKLNHDDFLGANDRIELAALEKLMQEKIHNKHMLNGVTIVSPATTYIAFNAIIGKDSVIYPNNHIGLNVEIGSKTIVNSFSYIEGAKIGDNSEIGPFARIRPNTIIQNKVFIGNFVEVNRSIIADNSKAKHLTYLGDIEIEENVNIGAGTIICNYDGINKHSSKIGKNTFVGSNSTVISPVNIGENSLIAAGTILTKDCSENEFVISRAEEKHLVNKASAIKEKLKNKKLK